MNRYYRIVVPLLAVLLLQIPVTVLALEPGDVRTFLTENYPRVSGTIVFQEDGQYYAEVSTNISQGRVEIYRRTVESTEKGKRLTDTVVGLVDLSLKPSDSLELDLPEPLQGSVRVGDQLRLPEKPMHIRNRSGLDTASLRDIVPSNAVTGPVLTKPKSELQEYYRLTVTDNALRLESVESDGTLRELSHRRFKGTKSSAEQKSRQPSTSELTRINRQVNDVELLEPSGDSSRLLVFGSRNKIGFARYDDSLAEITWDSITGNVLDVSVGPSKADDRESLLVVLKRNGTIRTRYYTFNPSNRSLDRLWTVSNRWVHRSSGNYYEQYIGLNTPFRYGLTRVQITDEGPRQTDTPEYLSEQYVYSPSYEIDGNRLYSVTKNQKLEVYNAKKQLLRSAEQYGGGPTVLSARNSGSKVNLNPEFLHWNTGGSRGEYLLLPRNIASGITAFRGLTSYSSSRLYLVKLEGATTNTLWESNRLPGYVSSGVAGDERALVTVVNGESGQTRIFEVDVGQLK